MPVSKHVKNSIIKTNEDQTVQYKQIFEKALEIQTAYN